MSRRKKPEKLRGARRMKEFGYKEVKVWLDAHEVEVIARAAQIAGLKLATWIREQAKASAEALVQTTTNEG